MAEYLSPGVYVEEYDNSPRSIEGVGTSTAGFIGLAEKGPLEGAPLLVTSMRSFKQQFGGFLSEFGYGEYRFLANSVEQFFDNGGTRCYVMRVAPRDAKPATAKKGILNVTATSPGTWGNKIQVMLSTNKKRKLQLVEKTDDKDAKGNVKRIDHAENNKPEWTGAKDTKVAWAAQAAPDKAGNTYSVTKKDGNKVVKRKDSGQFNAGAYNISKDKSKNKRAQVSSIDKNAASPIYKQESGHTVRKDKSDVNKGAYSISKNRNVAKYANEAKNSMERPEAQTPYSIEADGSTARYAQEASTSHDKPEARAPYSISDGSAPKYAAKSPKDGQKAEAKDPYKIRDGSATKYATKSPKDSEKPEARGPYKISDGSKAQFAATSPKDGEKPEARDPYSIKADGAKPKYAVPSPTNKPLQTPVTWPPTRRALMAENLKK